MDETKKTFYRYCLVPKCVNNIISAPNKVFFHVPKNGQIRKKWCKMMGRQNEKPTTSFYCCEDHFNVEEDTENYIEYKIMKEHGVNVPLRLKKGVLPHIFKCQNRNRSPPVNRVYSIKRQRLALINEVFSEVAVKSRSHVSEKPHTSSYVAGPSTAMIECHDSNAAGISTALISTGHDYEDRPGTAITEYHDNEVGTSTAIIEYHKYEARPRTALIGCPADYGDEVPRSNKSVQVNIKSKTHYRSKGTNANLKIEKKDAALSPAIYSSKNIATSPIKSTHNAVATNLFADNQVEESPSSQSSKVTGDYQPSSSSSELTCAEDDSGDEQYFKNSMRTVMLTAVEKAPKLLLGLNKKSYHLIKLLSDNIPLPTIDILITLKKIKLDESFDILALDFGYAQSTVSRIFSKSIPVIAAKMKQLITIQPPEKTYKNLPIAFRARYANVAAIIDALEIQIEKPSHVLHQSLTWSNYKKCNTLKYLISCTPDGLINFISEGYGGRITDILIVEDSGFLSTLHPNTAVTADRGFKALSPMLVEKNCTLIRPPSVSKSAPSTKEEVRESKRIAALRIHVERVISRLREFHMLKPHATVDHNLLSVIDEVIVVACGLVNMQDVLIKK